MTNHNPSWLYFKVPNGFSNMLEIKILFCSESCRLTFD